MDSETSLVSLRIPIVDFSIQPLKPGTPEWDSVRAQVRRALEEFGCFEAVFHKIPSEIRRALLEALQELFGLPVQTKLQSVSNIPFQGYMGKIPVLPLHESMGIYDADVYRNVESFVYDLWPQGNPAFCKTIQSYSEQVSELDQVIRRMIVESLGVEKYLEEHLGSTNYLLRLMKYEGPQTAESKLGLKAHTDKNFVTILDQNQVDGLEVQTKDGKWISVKPSLDSFVVVTGDSLHAWANGRLYSPKHRVMMTGNMARYSTGLFSIPKANYLIKAPEELVDQEHPLLFKPFDYSEFILVAGRNPESNALKIYCGI